MPSLHVHLIPSLTTPEFLAGGTVVVIDVLRATTTIVTALANGAVAVIPCQEVESAQAQSAKFPRDTVLLGGERGGLKIPGFDYGNSPAEYTRQSVVGKTLIFTTTNGTRAMQQARLARRIVIGAAVNLSVVAAAISDDPTVHLLCAGTDGKITTEDALIAGLLVRQIVSHVPHCQLSDAAQLALLAAEPITCSDDLVPLFRASRGGSNLIEVGLESDIPWCATVDQFAIAPELNLADGQIKLAW